MNKLRDLNKKLNEDCERKIKQIVREAIEEAFSLGWNSAEHPTWKNDMAEGSPEKLKAGLFKKYGLGGEGKTLDELKETRHEDDTSGV